MTGGFTLSGGEPLMQHRFAVKLFARARRRWASTPRSTPTATTATGSADAELETIDLVLLDIKTWDPERHGSSPAWTSAPTLEFARRLAARRRPIWVRFVLVPGPDRRPRRHRADRRVRGRPRQRRARRRAAVPPDGPIQVGEARASSTRSTTSSRRPTELVERTVAIYRSKGLVAY